VLSFCSKECFRSLTVIPQRIRIRYFSGLRIFALFITDTSCVHFCTLLFFSVFDLFGKVLIGRKRSWLSYRFRWRGFLWAICLWLRRGLFCLLGSWSWGQIWLGLLCDVSSVGFILGFWFSLGFFNDHNFRAFLWSCFLLRCLWFLLTVSDSAPNPY